MCVPLKLVPPPLPVTHRQEMLKFFEGAVPAIPKMELEDDGAAADPRLGRPVDGGGLYAWRRWKRGGTQDDMVTPR